MNKCTLVSEKIRSLTPTIFNLLQWTFVEVGRNPGAGVSDWVRITHGKNQVLNHLNQSQLHG